MNIDIIYEYLYYFKFVFCFSFKILVLLQGSILSSTNNDSFVSFFPSPALKFHILALLDWLFSTVLNKKWFQQASFKGKTLNISPLSVLFIVSFL